MTTGGFVGMRRPVTGAVMQARAERAALSLAQIASNNARVRRILLNFLRVLNTADIGMVGFDLFIASGVDNGRVPRDSLMTFTIQDVLKDTPPGDRELQAAATESVDDFSARTGTS